MAYHFFFTSIYPVLQKPCLRAPTLWFLFMQLNNESVWCSTWVESPNWVWGSWAKMLSDFKKCKVHWIETKSRQSRCRSKWECKRYNRTPQEKWSDHCIFSTPMKWKLCEYMFFLKITVTSVSGTKIIKFSTCSWIEEENREVQVAFWLLKSEIQTKPDKGWWQELILPTVREKDTSFKRRPWFSPEGYNRLVNNNNSMCVRKRKGKKRKKRNAARKRTVFLSRTSHLCHVTKRLRVLCRAGKQESDVFFCVLVW